MMSGSGHSSFYSDLCIYSRRSDRELVLCKAACQLIRDRSHFYLVLSPFGIRPLCTNERLWTSIDPPPLGQLGKRALKIFLAMINDDKHIFKWIHHHDCVTSGQQVLFQHSYILIIGPYDIPKWNKRILKNWKNDFFLKIVWNLENCQFSMHLKNML